MALAGRDVRAVPPCMAERLMVWCVRTRCDGVCSGVALLGVVSCGEVWYGAVWYGRAGMRFCLEKNFSSPDKDILNLGAIILNSIRPLSTERRVVEGKGANDDPHTL